MHRHPCGCHRGAHSLEARLVSPRGTAQTRCFHGGWNAKNPIVIGCFSIISNVYSTQRFPSVGCCGTAGRARSGFGGREGNAPNADQTRISPGGTGPAAPNTEGTEARRHGGDFGWGVCWRSLRTRKTPDKRFIVTFWTREAPPRKLFASPFSARSVFCAAGRCERRASCGRSLSDRHSGMPPRHSPVIREGKRGPSRPCTGRSTCSGR
jgi:hypothetical protein